MAFMTIITLLALLAALASAFFILGKMLTKSRSPSLLTTCSTQHASPAACPQLSRKEIRQLFRQCVHNNGMPELPLPLKVWHPIKDTRLNPVFLELPFLELPARYEIIEQERLHQTFTDWLVEARNLGFRPCDLPIYYWVVWKDFHMHYAENPLILERLGPFALPATMATTQSSPADVQAAYASIDRAWELYDQSVENYQRLQLYVYKIESRGFWD